jgi:uncharacterized protein
MRVRLLEQQRLEVILKIAERCNLNCSYCYFFNRGDNTYLGHAPLIARSVVHQVASFLVAGARAKGLRFVQIDFHGGEPLLMGKPHFAQMCEVFRGALTPFVDLKLCVQTNATLIDAAWIELFARYDVNVSTSLDGPAEYHDKARVDFAGQGTSVQTMAGIDLLRAAVKAGALPGFGVLCVINPDHSARRIYRHFVNELGLASMDFLLPLVTYDAPADAPAERFGDFLIELFDEWAADDEPHIQVRVLNSVMSLLLGGRAKVAGIGPNLAPAITIASDGSIGPDDTLRVCGSAYMDSRMNVATATLADYLDSPFMADLVAAQRHLPSLCKECCWARVCAGGPLSSRYSSSHEFDAPSIFCAGLKPFFAHVSRYLLDHGVPEARLGATLLGPDWKAISSAF